MTSLTRGTRAGCSHGAWSSRATSVSNVPRASAVSFRYSHRQSGQERPDRPIEPWIRLERRDARRDPRRARLGPVLPVGREHAVEPRAQNAGQFGRPAPAERARGAYGIGSDGEIGDESEYVPRAIAVREGLCEDGARQRVAGHIEHLGTDG